MMGRRSSVCFGAALSLALAACGSSNQNTGGGGATTTSSAGGSGGTASTSSTSSATETASTTTTTSTDTTTTSTTTPPLPCPGGPGELDLHLVTIYDNPPDLADWPITTTLKAVDFGADVGLDFDKKDGPSRWPDIVPPGWDGPLQYTLGMVECIEGQWYGSAAIQFWYGLPASGGNVADMNQVAVNWYYDGRWGKLAGRQPATGEVVGIFVAAGNLRGVTSDDPAQSPVRERSNVVLVPFPDVNGAHYSF